MSKEAMGKNVYDAVIIGAGASGVMAALSCIENHPSARVLILERQSYLLRKVKASGNGRCNIANLSQAASNYRSLQTKGADFQNFIESIFTQYDYAWLKQWWQKQGVLLKNEDLGRLYPVSESAETVLKILRHRLAQERIEVLLEAEVVGIAQISQSKQTKWQISYLQNSKEQKIATRNVILATGSIAAPQLGGVSSFDSGLTINGELPLKISPFKPALSPVVTEFNERKDLPVGQRFHGKISCTCGEEPISTQGELQITDYGLSGIPALDLSVLLHEHLSNQIHTVKMKQGNRNVAQEYYRLTKPVAGEIDWANGYELTKLWSSYWVTDNTRRSLRIDEVREYLTLLLAAVVKPKIAKYLTEQTLNQLPEQFTLRQLQTKTERVLHHLPLRLIGVLSFNQAQVALGGIDLAEVDQQSMGLLNYPGLYACGECVDVCGRTGGYNLQWSWASGYLAGKLKGRNRTDES